MKNICIDDGNKNEKSKANLINTNRQNRYAIGHIRHARQTVRAITNRRFNRQSYNRDCRCERGHHAGKVRGAPGGSDDDLDTARAGFLGVLGH